MKRYVTGIKPTGNAHIGNYFGAIKPAIEFSEQEGVESFYFMADYHALTTIKSGEELREHTYEIACTWLACGLNPDKVVMYRQSDIPEVFELFTIINNVTPKGLMNRAHAYKAIVEKNAEQGINVDDGVNMGLYRYPVLMAADIFMVDADYVPVGLDQKQHIEIARDIATYFNNRYGNVLKAPEEYIDKQFAVLEGLDGRKMSKSYNNTIGLFLPENQLKKTINRIVTDSSLPTDPKPLDCTVNKLYKLFATAEEQEAFDAKLTAGIGWGDAKKELFEVANRYISPMRAKYDYYMSHRDEVDKILEDGAKKARVYAREVIQKVRKAIGVK